MPAPATRATCADHERVRGLVHDAGDGRRPAPAAAPAAVVEARAAVAAAIEAAAAADESARVLTVDADDHQQNSPGVTGIVATASPPTPPSPELPRPPFAPMASTVMAHVGRHLELLGVVARRAELGGVGLGTSRRWTS